MVSCVALRHAALKALIRLRDVQERVGEEHSVVRGHGHTNPQHIPGCHLVETGRNITPEV